MIRTDLVIETFDGQKLDENGGIKQFEETFENMKITKVSILNEKARLNTGKPIGDYITIEVTPFSQGANHSDEAIERVARELSDMLPDDGVILVAGLGNDRITPDAVGPLAAGKVIATRHIPPEVSRSFGVSSLRPVAAITPGVLGCTGIETAEVIASVCGRIQPCCVIVIDALAARDSERLGNTIQISNTGISPGSGVQNKRKEISEKTLGVPVVAIGVPTVIDVQTMLHKAVGGSPGGRELDLSDFSMMVTPRDIDLLVEHAADTVALSLNKALQPELSVGDITCLM